MLFKKDSERLCYINSDEKLVKDEPQSKKFRSKCCRPVVGILVVVGLLVSSVSVWAVVRYVNKEKVYEPQSDPQSTKETNQQSTTKIFEDGSGSISTLVTRNSITPVVNFHSKTQQYDAIELLDIKDHISTIQNNTLLRFANLKNSVAELVGRVNRATQTIDVLTENITSFKNQIHNLSGLFHSLSFIIGEQNNTGKHEKEENNQRSPYSSQILARKFSAIRKDITEKVQNSTLRLKRLINTTGVNLTNLLNTTIHQQVQNLERNFASEISLVSDNSRLFCEESVSSEIIRLHSNVNATIHTLISKETSDRRKNLTSIQSSLRNQRAQVRMLQSRTSDTENNLQVLGGRITTCENITSLLQLQMTKKADAGWIQAPNGYAYKVIRRKMSWYQGRDACQAQGGTLAYVGLRSNSGGKMHDYIFRNVVEPIGATLTYSPLRPPVNVWFGLNDIDAEFMWKWLDGKTLQPRESHWMRRKPYHVHLDCAEMQISQGTWKDYRCSESHTNYALCEKRVVG